MFNFRSWYSNDTDKNESLVHLVRSDPPKKGFPGGFAPPSDPVDRLISIVQDNKIRASYLQHMKYVNPQPTAVCFSDASPDSLKLLTKPRKKTKTPRYTKNGILLHKRSVFRRGGGPVWYVNNDDFRKMTNDCHDDEMEVFIDPRYVFLLQPYAPAWQSEVKFNDKTWCDWMCEREWRTNEDFELPYNGGQPNFKILVESRSTKYRITQAFPKIDSRDIILFDSLPSHVTSYIEYEEYRHRHID